MPKVKGGKQRSKDLCKEGMMRAKEQEKVRRGGAWKMERSREGKQRKSNLLSKRKESLTQSVSGFSSFLCPTQPTVTSHQRLWPDKAISRDRVMS